MDDILSHSPRVSREALHGLMARSDAPGLAHLLASLALLVTAGIVASILAAAGDPWWPAASFACGLALVSFFPALHESSHGTAFRSPLLGRATAWLSAALMLQAPSFFREFHFEHHRQTHDPERDPEIAMAHGLLGVWPKNLCFYLALVSGQGLLFGKAMFTISCALLPYAAWRRLFPWIREAHASAVAWESRLVLLLLAAAVYAGLTYVPGCFAVLLAWPIAHVLLGFYLMPEHTGLGHTGSQLHRTRTITSNAAVRWWMWNMPYHGEHHASPPSRSTRCPACTPCSPRSSRIRSAATSPSTSRPCCAPSCAAHELLHDAPSPPSATCRPLPRGATVASPSTN